MRIPSINGSQTLAAPFLDMDWHMLTDVTEVDADKFEEASLKKTGLIPEIVFRYQSTNFGQNNFFNLPLKSLTND